MNEHDRKGTPDLVGPVMERLGYQRSSVVHRGPSTLAIVTVLAAGVLASCSLIVLSFFANQQSSVAQTAQSGDVISDAILRSRQDVAQIGEVIFSLQSPSQDPQDMTSKALHSGLREAQALPETTNEDIEGSFNLEATSGNDGRYDDMAAREASQSK